LNFTGSTTIINTRKTTFIIKGGAFFQFNFLGILIITILDSSEHVSKFAAAGLLTEKTTIYSHTE